jgi:hypothetical protein
MKVRIDMSGLEILGIILVIGFAYGVGRLHGWKSAFKSKRYAREKFYP